MPLGQNSATIEHDSDLLVHILVAQRAVYTLAHTQAFLRTHKIGNDICVALPVRRLCRQSSMNSQSSTHRLVGGEENTERRKWGCRISCVHCSKGREIEKRHRSFWRAQALAHRPWYTGPGTYIAASLWSVRYSEGFRSFSPSLWRSSTSCSICAVNYGAQGFLSEIFHILPSFFTMFLCHSKFCLTLRESAGQCAFAGENYQPTQGLILDPSVCW